MEEGKTAILMATYNGEKFLEEQLDSIFTQTYQNFTLYIRDDGSTDATLSIIETYSQKYPGRISLLIDGRYHLGAGMSFLQLMKSVDADYYFFSDQDDVWRQEKVEKLLNRLKSLQVAYPKLPICVHSDGEVVDMNLQRIYPSHKKYGHVFPEIEKDVYRMLVYNNPVSGCMMCFNKAARGEALKHEGFVTDLGGYQDELVAFSTVIYGCVDYIEYPYVLHRIHGHNDSDNHNRIQKGGVKILLRPWIFFNRTGYRCRRLKAFGIQPNYMKMLLIMIERFTINRKLYKEI